VTQIGFVGLGKMGGNMSSRGSGDYSARMLAALRNQFGGHAVKAASKS
jgi:6-phosphogluconate dehydrogenase (decarboxylating)